LQIFFGNIAQLTDTIKEILKEKEVLNEVPIVVIVDFTLVVGMDSSAAHAVAKLKKIIHRLFGVEVSIFVTGSDRDGFPCEYALSEDLCPKVLTRKTGGQVCESLDEALRFAEDILIARNNPSLVNTRATSYIDLSDLSDDLPRNDMTLEEEKYRAKKYLKELFWSSEPSDDDVISAKVDILFSLMERKEYEENQALWEYGDESDSAQLLVFGELVSIIEDTGAVEQVRWGNLVGELGLVHGTKRLTTLLCSTEKAVLYSLDKEAWQVIKDKHPQLARMIDGIVIRYLAHRVQHVSNRYFHTTLPI
jgi:SulP family sulfate permease